MSSSWVLATNGQKKSVLWAVKEKDFFPPLLAPTAVWNMAWPAGSPVRGIVVRSVVDAEILELVLAHVWNGNQVSQSEDQVRRSIRRSIRRSNQFEDWNSIKWFWGARNQCDLRSAMMHVAMLWWLCWQSWPWCNPVIQCWCAIMWCNAGGGDGSFEIRTSCSYHCGLGWLTVKTLRLSDLDLTWWSIMCGAAPASLCITVQITVHHCATWMMLIFLKIMYWTNVEPSCWQLCKLIVVALHCIL